ncbi:MAG: nuclease A inhibitor family protein [Pyrinomonadaceae bacterium]|nr:nuclease A inhibitor family protein [Pyrinomonadaceae bacterium]
MIELEKACQGLVYISETDSDIVPFVTDAIDKIDPDNIFRLCKADPSTNVEIIEESAFFHRLTEKKDWFGPRENDRAARFLKLRQLLTSRLTDISVFRIGKVRIEIIVAGLDKDRRVAGIRTIAVET